MTFSFDLVTRGYLAGVGSNLLLYIVVGTALAFEFTNGFHDTANAVATSITTMELPRSSASPPCPSESSR